MFTGIVEAVGEVTAVDADDDGRRLTVAAPFADALSPGESVSVSGTCLTVEAAAEGTFAVFLASETVARTGLGDLTAGDGVNLERAMPADGRFDGHLVQGHVDATTELLDVEPVGEDWTFTFAMPEGLERYIVEKGSIALDGVSLTVADRLDDRFTVAIIPTTYRETTFDEREPGDRLNVEVDVLAKYVERQLAERP
ncbi:MAG: riboflavin synthase [Halobacteriales archaeon]|nr:riboflavin synthase [Halobacteriales archaeon]